MQHGVKMTDSMNLSQEDHDSTSRQETRLNSALLCSLVQIARVVIVRVILVGVLGVMIVVLIGHDEVLVNVVIYVAIFVVIFCHWRCTLYIKEDDVAVGPSLQRHTGLIAIAGALHSKSSGAAWTSGSVS